MPHEIAEFRANLHMLENELRWRRPRLAELEEEVRKRGAPPDQAMQAEMNEHKGRIAHLEELHTHVAPELDAMLRQCREIERAPDAERDEAALESSLRKTIDDPRYWRDGDPALTQSVSDGFKRLYPDD